VKKEAEDSGNAIKLLQFSSYLDYRRIDYALLRSPETTKSEEFATKQLPSWFQAVVKTEATLRRSVGILQNYSLIRLVGDAFTVHPVVSAWCYSSTPNDNGELCRTAAVVIASGRVPNSMPSALLSGQKLLPHADVRAHSSSSITPLSSKPSSPKSPLCKLAPSSVHKLRHYPSLH
jgi:hypothetical protein